MADCALVIGSETMSRIVDWNDRATCVLFGDGAGAVVLQAVQNEDRGILATRLHADGQHQSLLYVDGGPSTTGTVGSLRMKGAEVFGLAVTNLTAVFEELLATTGDRKRGGEGKGEAERVNPGCSRLIKKKKKTT